MAITFLLLLALSGMGLSGQSAPTPPRDTWRAPFPAHRIVGNVHYVGTYDLACFLITTPEGHILINTGLADSTALLRRSVEALGFRFGDIKILLTQQAHFDHVAAMAEVKRLTGARLLATERDAPVLEDGGRSDYHLGKEHWFAAATVDGRLTDGHRVRLGGTELTVRLSPGHTKGSATYLLTASEGGKAYRVVIANFGTINPGVTLVNNPKYPEIAEDYGRTFREQKGYACDVFLAAHASQYGLHEKFRPGAPHDPERFVDPKGYRALVEKLEAAYQEQLARERAAAR